MSAVVRSFALGAAALLSGCAFDGGTARTGNLPPRGPAPRVYAGSERVEEESTVRRAEGGVIARVAGREIGAAQLLEQWLQRDSSGLWDQLNLLIAGELARLEAERLGVHIGPLEADRRLSAHLGALTELWRERYPSETFDRVLRERLQLDPERFRARLRAETLRELVTERVVRFSSLGSERARLRVATLATREAALDIAVRARAGEDLAELARAHSLDPSGKAGGLLPPIAFAADAPLARLAFAAPVGVVDGPFELGTRHVVLRVEERIAPLAGTYAERAEDVEASLAAEPVSEAEFVAWQVEAERRFRVDLAPFLRLVGEPLPPSQ